MSNEHARLYNHLLENVWERIKNGNGIDYKQLNRDYVIYRNENKLTIPSKSAQNTSRVLINNINSYYALKKTDPNARFPKKFKTTHQFQAFSYDWNGGIGGFKIKDNRLEILKPRISITIPQFIMDDADFDDIRAVRFHSGPKGGLYCSLSVAIFTEDKQLDPTRFLSIDPGLKSIMTGVTCDGEFFNLPNFDFRYQDKANDRIRSKRDKKKKYSNRYKRLSTVLKRNTSKTVNRRKDYQHKSTKAIIDFCEERNIGLIIHGDIKTKQLTKSKFANKHLNKSSQNRGTLSRVKQYLAYKACSNGIVHVLQNEAYTSKTNCYTGEIMQNMTLSTREIELTEGLTIDRDVNGAINIANKYFRQDTGVWYPQLSWLSALKNTRIVYNMRMSKFE